MSVSVCLDLSMLNRGMGELKLLLPKGEELVTLRKVIEEKKLSMPVILYKDGRFLDREVAQNLSNGDRVKAIPVVAGG